MKKDVRPIGWRAKLRSIGLPVRLVSAQDRSDIRQSGLFDADWYLARAPEAGASGLDPLDHYLTNGWRAGLSPGPQFDAAWYLGRYNDVAAADHEPLLHFIRFGRDQGRLACAPTPALFDGFLSLGEDCEFGIVQRHFGSETIDLLHFAQVPIDGLIAALKARFAALDSPAALQLGTGATGEYEVVLPAYHLRFHTELPSATVTAERAMEVVTRRLFLLRRKFLDELEEGGRTLVYKSRPRAKVSKAKIRELLATVRQFGPHRLLWVTRAARTRVPGTAKLLEEGLAHGYMDRFTVRPTHCSYDVWQRVCSEAARLLPADEPRPRPGP